MCSLKVFLCVMDCPCVNFWSLVEMSSVNLFWMLSPDCHFMHTAQTTLGSGDISKLKDERQNSKVFFFFFFILELRVPLQGPSHAMLFFVNESEQETRTGLLKFSPGIFGGLVGPRI